MAAAYDEPSVHSVYYAYLSRCEVLAAATEDWEEPFAPNLDPGRGDDPDYIWRGDFETTWRSAGIALNVAECDAGPEDECRTNHLKEARAMVDRWNAFVLSDIAPAVKRWCAKYLERHDARVRALGAAASAPESSPSAAAATAGSDDDDGGGESAAKRTRTAVPTSSGDDDYEVRPDGSVPLAYDTVERHTLEAMHANPAPFFVLLRRDIVHIIERK